jgi:hypothetical protein
MQTRRVMKPQPILSKSGSYWSWKNCSWTDLSPHCPIGTLEIPVDFCPYGQVGDRLWVRETFCNDCPSASEPSGVCYKANRENQPASDFCTKWKPSIFMPRWASRITLEITDIRVERLNEITKIHDEVAKEGWPFGFKDIDTAPVNLFIKLWDSINGKKYSWADNPFVWVISFKRV